MTRAELAQHMPELPTEEPATLDPELLASLRERLADAKANPGAGVPWEEVKADLLRSL